MRLQLRLRVCFRQPWSAAESKFVEIVKAEIVLQVVQLIALQNPECLSLDALGIFTKAFATDDEQRKCQY